ncbi:MAG: hypothetical protein SNJ75_17460 [Gemmataceae bacterium]
MSELPTPPPTATGRQLPIGNLAFYRGLSQGIRLTLAALETLEKDELRHLVASWLEELDQRIAQTQFAQAERSPAAMAAMLADLDRIERGEEVGRDFEEFLDELARKHSLLPLRKNGPPAEKAG